MTGGGASFEQAPLPIHIARWPARAVPQTAKRTGLQEPTPRVVHTAATQCCLTFLTPTFRRRLDGSSLLLPRLRAHRQTHTSLS